MERRLNSKPKASLCCHPLCAPCYCPSPLKLENCAALIKLSPQKLACSQNYIYMQNPWRLLSWNESKTAEDEKITSYNIMKITHLEGIHLTRKVFFFLSFWTFSLCESHCAAANSKKCLFCKSPLESGSKAFS